MIGLPTRPSRLPQRQGCWAVLRRTESEGKASPRIRGEKEEQQDVGIDDGDDVCTGSSASRYCRDAPAGNQAQAEHKQYIS